MADERVDVDQLVEQVARLAADHNVLVAAVRDLLDHDSMPCPDDTGAFDVHVPADRLLTLRRIVGGP